MFIRQIAEMESQGGDVTSEAILSQSTINDTYLIPD